MGSAPKAPPAPEPPPPPVRQTGEDIAMAKESERKKQGDRKSYAQSINPSRSLFAPQQPEQKRTLLG